MTKQQAQKIAALMVKKRVSGFAGRRTIALLLDVDLKKITPAREQKIMREFYKLVVAHKGTQYPAIQKLHAEEELEKLNG